MEPVIDTEEKRIRRMRQLGMLNNKPMNLIKMQSKYGEDLDYSPGKDDGEPPHNNQ